jgi:hypothetical protein
MFLLALPSNPSIQEENQWCSMKARLPLFLPINHACTTPSSAVKRKAAQENNTVIQ